MDDLQADQAEDWVIGTGKSISVRDFVRLAFQYVGIELEFVGAEENEIGIVKSCSIKKYSMPIGKEVVAVDKNYYRPTEVDALVADIEKVKNKLGWSPSYNIEELVIDMMKSELENI